MYKFFGQNEIIGLNAKLVQMLDTARGIAGIPFVLTSTVRSAEHNAEVGGVANSSHIKGLAVDISAESGTQKYLIVSALLDLGFKRIGVYLHHIHTDIDEEKPQNVIWTS